MICFTQYKVAHFVILLAFVFGFSACQRAPQAYFAPTAHPAAQRLATTVPTVDPVADPLVTASVTSLPEPTTTPVYESVATTPSVEPAIHVEVGRSTVWHRMKRMMSHKSVPPGCDQIVLRNGDVIDAKIKEVGVNEIKYKKCDRQDGPDYTISKRDVLSIKYSNGEVERFNASPTQSNNNSSGSRQSYDSPTNRQNNGPRTDPFAIVSLASGAVALLIGVGGLLLVAAAIVFGGISLSRIKREPDRFKGRGLALGGLIAGVVIGGLIVLAYLL
ncbi:DUF4190 domain-containing protein [Spirosoma arcticum]